MMNGSTITDGAIMKVLVRRELFMWLLLLAALLSLAACGGDNEATGENGAVTENDAQTEGNLTGSQVRLVCDDRCAERAQCGALEDGSLVGFMKRDNPDVNNHDLTYPAGTVASVLGTGAEQVEEIVTGTLLTTTFFKLLLPDGITQAWVTDWCVER